MLRHAEIAGQAIDLFHVMAGMGHMELSPTNDLYRAQNWMVGNLRFTAEAVLSFRERLIHFFQVREDQFSGLLAADPSWEYNLRRLSAGRNVSELEDRNLSHPLLELG